MVIDILFLLLYSEIQQIEVEHREVEVLRTGEWSETLETLGFLQGSTPTPKVQNTEDLDLIQAVWFGQQLLKLPL